MPNYLKNENHLVIHGWMINELALKGLPLMIFAIIYGFTQTDEQYFTGSLKYLSEWTGSTTRACVNAINTLIELGYVEREKYKDTKNIGRTRYITLLGDSEKNSLGDSEKFSHSEKNSLPPMKKIHYPSNNINNNINNIYIKKENIKRKKDDDLFSVFWDTYPRKVAKARAVAEWEKIAPSDETANVIIAAVKDNIRYNTQWQRDNGQYIPHAATWLHQKRWTDELTNKPTNEPVTEKYEVEL